ncbi:sec-independent protein translocase protein TatB [Williamsia muralis]|uniref:Sec-independent protein translocase protein TatB n=1 Tax=Williamsia marianensis TaxID=85044 RepID=A0A495K438_WILMA|nr:Sec-independent protein translocase protein TatB [Williamsia muralis]RKR96047.1 sec-independent protein translocase protein TatB [Williamsia muralis]
MFSSVGWGEIAILMIAGLVILGPERLPGAVTWAMKSVRQVRDYATGATAQLKEDLGPEFDDLRKPLSDLNELRGMTPRSVITKHLLDGDDSFFTGKFDSGDAKIKPVSQPLPTTDENSQVISLNKAGIEPSKPEALGAGTSTTSPVAADADNVAPAPSGVERWDAT